MAALLAFISLPASPASADTAKNADIAASWVALQVNADGFIPLANDPSKPNVSLTMQAVQTFAAAGVGKTQADAVMTYIGAHVEDFVVRSGVDDPGALAYVILDAVATGQDPTTFGTTDVDLVARLGATKQSDGLFGATDPTFDGAFRQGLALMALHAAGQSDADAIAWLEDQQCDDGLWTAFRSDTNVPCPAVDPNTFAGPDTNSTALAVLGLAAQGRASSSAAGAAALASVRNGGGGWGFLASSDQPTDANSTGLVVSALQSVNGTQDAQGVAAILALQLPCTDNPADSGGIAFQDFGGGLTPDVFATEQAVPALAGVTLPLGPVVISPDLVPACAAPDTTTTTSTTTTTAPATTEEDGTSTAGELPRTGSSSLLLTGVSLTLIGGGGMLVQLAAERRRKRV
jgi:hypothetical protein